MKQFYRVALGSMKSKKSYLPQERRNRLLKSVTKYVTLASWPGWFGPGRFMFGINSKLKKNKKMFYTKLFYDKY